MKNRHFLALGAALAAASITPGSAATWWSLEGDATDEQTLTVPPICVVGSSPAKGYEVAKTFGRIRLEDRGDEVALIVVINQTTYHEVVFRYFHTEAACRAAAAANFAQHSLGKYQ